MRNHIVMWKAEKILENPLATKVGEAWSDWRKIVIAKTQLQPPFQDKTEFQRLSSPRWSEERVNWVPNWGRWERLHIGPYSRRASQPAKAGYKKSHSIWSMYMCVFLIVWRLTGETITWQEKKKKYRSHLTRLPVAEQCCSVTNYLGQFTQK